MNCITDGFPRISARRGRVVDLNVDFYNNGVLADPYAIRRVEIYKGQVNSANLVATIPFVDPTDELYPAPACQEYTAVSSGFCGTEAPEPSSYDAGKYHLGYTIPSDFAVPNIYYDVWYYYATNPVGESGTGTEGELDDDLYADYLLSCCHRFWVYPDDWFCDDKLQTIRLGFEPLDQKFYTPELRPLEVAITPLPLYDFNYNMTMQIIPYMQATISIETQHHELLIDKAACRIGLRQGSYRTNPYVLQYDLDTTAFYKGSYAYWITATLPNGQTRTSKKFILTIL